jgi:hypothetical protein
MSPHVIRQVRTDRRQELYLDPDEAEDEIFPHLRLGREAHLAVFVTRELELEKPSPGKYVSFSQLQLPPHLYTQFVRYDDFKQTRLCKSVKDEHFIYRLYQTSLKS